jgi:cytochrome c oxidase assembly factor 6
MAWGLDWMTGSSTPSQPTSTAPRSNDGGYVAPDRTTREVCYESRDIFFQCLDKNNILDAIKEDEKARKVCPTEVTAYERDCARSWVSPNLPCERDMGLWTWMLKYEQIKYFKEKRVMEWKRDQTIAQIQADDAKAVAKAKEKKSAGGWFS